MDFAYIGSTCGLVALSSLAVIVVGIVAICLSALIGIKDKNSLPVWFAILLIIGGVLMMFARYVFVVTSVVWFVCLFL